MNTPKSLTAGPGIAAAGGLGAVFFAGCTWASYVHWANFEYRSFDLAYYVQALWQFIHGRFDVSLLGAPLLGNHVEPIVFLMVPFFFVCRHPMILVVLQNVALAAMAPMAFGIARRLGLSAWQSIVLAAAILVTPATGYIALHEFHPEALAAPCLMFVIWARLRSSRALHWVGLCALLACKENMALLIAAYCAVYLLVERRRPGAELRAWYMWPLALAIIWFVLCAKVITPALNSGAIDYLALYDRLGASPGDIVLKSFTEPHRFIHALGQSLQHGNLLWALLFPFLGLSLLRPRWLIIATPILFQHLLSWRSSEWQIYFHYAAPLVPLFWIAMAEGVAGLRQSSRLPPTAHVALPWLVMAACIASQIFLGPAAAIGSSLSKWQAGQSERARKRVFIAQIPPAASAVAPLPYLSHLAKRENLQSLHFILKGLKTLSRSTYEPPPPTDFVLIDYGDSATFDPGAGYYHPAMKTVDGRVIASSDCLLHDFLKRASWSAESANELTLLRRGSTSPDTQPFAPAQSDPIQIDPGTTLNAIGKSAGPALEIAMTWTFHEPRQTFPWLLLKLTPQKGGPAVTVTRGLCSPDIGSGVCLEKWRVVATPSVPAGDYDAEAIFMDYAKALWKQRSDTKNQSPPVTSVRVPLGPVKVAAE
ncbi:MAG TPA: DUF2079 domain-containing protein [Chthoniobacterales bacterium]